MKKPGSNFYFIFIFILAQLAWFGLLGIWIYWYVTNYLLLDQFGDRLSPQVVSSATNVGPLVIGLILLVLLSISMFMFFIYLNRQMSISRLYDNFIANVTHELKSPLSSIQLHLETMRKRKVSQEQRDAFLGLMLRDVGRLNQLINSILYLSSLEHKKMVKKVSHDYHIYYANSILREILNEVREEYKLPSERFEIAGKVDCECVIDRNWIKIVFSNLTDNAVKYSEDDAQIKVVLYKKEKFFHVDFIDHGIGIPNKDLKRIFNKFQRIENPYNPSVSGTGLGLYWVKEIIEYHGGRIYADSPVKNQGTMFRIALPIYQTAKMRYMKRLLKLSKKNKTDTNNE